MWDRIQEWSEDLEDRLAFVGAWFYAKWEWLKGSLLGRAVGWVVGRVLLIPPLNFCDGAVALVIFLYISRVYAFSGGLALPEYPDCEIHGYNPDAGPSCCQAYLEFDPRLPNSAGPDACSRRWMTPTLPLPGCELCGVRYLTFWEPVMTDGLASAAQIAECAAILAASTGYWTLRSFTSVTRHSSAAQFPGAVLASSHLWVGLVPVAAALLGCVAYAYSLRHGFVRMSMEQALWRMLWLPGDSSDTSMSERTLVGTETFELMKKQLATRLYDGLLGPRNWVDNEQPVEKTVIPREPLMDTRRTSIFQADVVLELAGYGAFLVVGLVFFAALLNEVGRVRCNDGDIIERPKVHVYSTAFHIVYMELVYFYISFKHPIVLLILGLLTCIRAIWSRWRRWRDKAEMEESAYPLWMLWTPVKRPREALAQLLHHSVTKEMARTLSRCPGPMQAHKSKSEKEQALHFGCMNLEDLKDCVAVFARTPREAQTVADCIKAARIVYCAGRHSQRQGFLAGLLAETYCPPPGLIVGAEIRAMTFQSQRTSRQLRKVRLDQYELRDFCSKMAAQYNRLEDTQSKISDAINAHMAENARLENVGKFQALIAKQAAEARHSKKEKKEQ